MINKLKKHLSRQVSLFKHEWLIRNSTLSKIFLIYQAFLFILIFHPIVFIIGFIFGVFTLKNPISTGFELLEEVT